MKKISSVLLIIIIFTAIIIPIDAKAETLDPYIPSDSIPREQYNPQKPYSPQGCLTIDNLDKYSDYKIIFLIFNSSYYDFIELKNNECVTLTAGNADIGGGSLYAIKNTDYNLWQTIHNEYKIRTNQNMQNDVYVPNLEDYYNNTYLPTMRRIAIVSAYTNKDLFPYMDENGNNVEPPAPFRYELTASISSITSRLNLSLKQRSYIYSNGTKKTVDLQGVTSTTKPVAKTTTPPQIITPAKPTLTSSILTKTTAQNKTATLTQTTTGLRTTDILTLSGTTSPNAKVTLTIQSNPINVDLTADQAGKWTYTLNPKTLKLPLGNHTISAVATDTKGVKSDPVTLATFTLKTPPVQTPIKPDKYNPFNLTNYIALAVLIVLGVMLAFLINRRKNSL